MRKIGIREASDMMGISEQCLRVMIQNNAIPGAICYGSKKRRTYYLTDEIIENVTRGERGNS